MASTTIVVPFAIGDTIYKKKTEIVTCRYFGDCHAGEDGQPNCNEHEYDCDFGRNCNAKYRYSVEPEIVNDFIMLDYVRDHLTGSNYARDYLLTKEDADSWVAEQYAKQATKEGNTDNVENT